MGFASTLLQLCGFHYNSWAKWERAGARSAGFCLPLPPPLGCGFDDGFARVEVLEHSHTDFRIFTLVGALLTMVASTICVLMVNHKSKIARFLARNESHHLPFYLYFISAVLNIISCLIATFRISATNSMRKLASIPASLNFYSSLSASFYCCCASVVVSLLATALSYSFTFDEQMVELASKRNSKTIKQHMSRNLMYPKDRCQQKMITFSSMPSYMEELAAEISVKATTRFSMEEDIAECVKSKFEEAYGKVWHCIVGESYGSALEHRPDEYIEVALPNKTLLIFRCCQK